VGLNQIELSYAYVRANASIDPSLVIEGAKLDLNQGLATFGMDSLMTIELKNRLQASVGKTLSSTIVFDHPTVSALAEYLEQNVLREAEDSKEAADEAKLQDHNAELIEVTELSEEEAEAMLAKELSS